MKEESGKFKVLFLCTKNSCRSQMAEGWARHLKAESIEPYSAGIEKHVLDPRAVRVMAEKEIDVSNHYSKLVDELTHITFDYMITVCDNAHERCPVFPTQVKVLHVGFQDPQRLAEETADEEGILKHYRRTRDEIRLFIETLPEALLK